LTCSENKIRTYNWDRFSTSVIARVSTRSATYII